MGCAYAMIMYASAQQAAERCWSTGLLRLLFWLRAHPKPDRGNMRVLSRKAGTMSAFDQTSWHGNICMTSDSANGSMSMHVLLGTMLPEEQLHVGQQLSMHVGRCQAGWLQCVSNTCCILTISRPCMLRLC